MSDGSRPTPTRRNYRPAAGGPNSGGHQTGFLIDIVSKITNTASEDQKEFEVTRLERAFKESSERIDRLVKNHQQDVEQCVDSFREVSTRVTNCRERLTNVRNALFNCKKLLENRRDDLRKLWVENAEQKHICDIYAQLEKLKEAPAKIEQEISKANFQEAANAVSSSLELVDGKFKIIEGLSGLRITILELSDVLLSKIIDEIVKLVVVDPFESKMFDLIRGLPELKIQENELCAQLYKKMSSPPPTESLASRLSRMVAAIIELKREDVDLNTVASLARSQIEKQVAASVQLMRVRASCDQIEGDSTHLAQLMQMIVAQLEASRSAHALLDEIVATSISKPNIRILTAFWESIQAAIETLVSDHLDISSTASGSSSTKEAIDSSEQMLFRFDAAAFGGASSVAHSQASRVVCSPTPYNIVPIFPHLRKIIDSVESSTGQNPCPLRRYVHSFVMEMFVDRVRRNMEERMEQATNNLSTDVPTNNNKILPSAERMFELCKEVRNLIVSIDMYAERFVALWILFLQEYCRNMQMAYEKVTPTSTGDGRRKKISAAWVADEDISRLLMSLPNWQLAATSMTCNQLPATTPATPAVESEREIGERNERESEILIGNLGTQKRIDKAELISDMSDVKSLALLHESLRWIAEQIRQLVQSLPSFLRNQLKSVKLRIHSSTGEESTNVVALDAIMSYVKRLESISDSCLLMLHLELRVHCFYHLLPLATANRPSSHDEVDPEVVELGRELHAFNKLLLAILSQPKLRYIFDGLGHLCAAIFIHSSQHIPRLSEAGRKRACRNVWGVQQRLSQITARREAELDRAKSFFELLTNEPDDLLGAMAAHRDKFSHIELGYLLHLSIRSHPILASQHGALENRMNQLNALLRKTAA
ncbi:hypothetical protein WR25_23801 [Diploscapter pachys]|uniref:Exocyst complex component Sec8 n=1 Tax=Diploscapter pachys TaxID=2018661 RepID=A0A2A2LT11_9BILA|nr:hypothetical protein WR25_23801 [Diploscapter pachys]